MADRSSFAQWLKQRRKALGLTQKELAQQAGCAEITLRKIESGDLQPSAPLVASLAKALGAADADLPGLLSLARGAGDDFPTRARLLRPQRANNLPAQLTPLIGREHDVAAVRKRLLSDGARLVTLLGPPGVGKTRLALAVAEEVLEHFEHGAFFVRLGPVSDPALVPSAIAQALGLEMSGSNPSELQLRAWLEEKHLLLVLDNFEQIVAAAPLVDDLLRRCPWLHVLVTSRQPLRVRGERQIPVQPLALPVTQPGAGRLTGDDALRYAAVALFAERAEAVQPDFAVDDGNAAAVAELCRRLDGLPLAIELVAARVKLLSPDELLLRLRGPWLLSADGLRDVSARQRTLRGAIGWSYDLLPPVEQTLFTRLAVFVGGCTLEAAEMMCEDILSPAQVLDSIASLLDKSLLHREPGLHGEPRYVMLETVREYALERLALADQERTLRERHASCCLRLIEKAEQTGLDPYFIQVRRLVADEINNLRAALAWAMQHDVQAALVLAASLLDWFYSQGPYAEGRHLIDEVFALPGASDHTIPRVMALVKAAALLLDGGGMTLEAQAFVEEGLALSQELGYDRGEADAYWILASVASDGWQDLDAADNYLERSLAIFRSIGDPVGIAGVQWSLSEAALCRADLSRALALAQDAVAVAQQGGFRFPHPLWTLGSIAYAEGDLDRARSLYEQAVAVERQRAGPIGVFGRTLFHLGRIATRQGDFTAAHTYFRQALARTRQCGGDSGIALFWCYLLMAILVQEEGDYGNAVRWYGASLPGMRSLREEWSDWGLGLAALAEALGQHELASRLLGATETMHKAGYRLLPIELDDYNRLAEAARAHLGTARFDAAWVLGQKLEFEQVVVEAVSILEAALHASEHPSRFSRSLL
jgi:predicted ATPase/DNA-binding XRE family transcriptional regulator